MRSRHSFVLLSLAVALLASLSYGQSSSNPSIANFSIAEPGFYTVFGNSPTITLLYNASKPLFHEAAIYHAQSDSLFVTSNRIPTDQPEPATSNQTILLNRVTNVSSSDLSAIHIKPISTTEILLPNGGTNYPTGSSSDSGILICVQGSKKQTSGIYSIPSPIRSPNISVPIVTSFYGREFNSPNDAVVNPLDGDSIWFTDPSYGYLQGVRPAPVLPNQVYRYDPATNSTRVVADGFIEPNGLAFSSDHSVLYITDTGASNFPDGNGPATIYAFDVVYKDGSGPFLGNKRVFAYAPAGIPDGIKTDAHGNVYSGTGIGLTVWDSSGLLLGSVAIEGGVANFGIASVAQKTMAWIMGEKLLWRVDF